MPFYRDPWGMQCCTECGETKDLCQCVDPDRAAHERLTTLEGQFQKQVLQKIHEENLGINNQDFLLMLMTELGDLSQKLRGHQHGDAVTGREILRTTVTISALATILGIQGDDDFAYDPSTLFRQRD